MSSFLKNLPSLGELLESPPLKSLVNRVSRNVVVTSATRFLDDLRSQVQTATAGMNIPSPSELAERIAAWITTTQAPGLRPAINATGILLPGACGGCPVAEEAITAFTSMARGYGDPRGDLAGEVERLLIERTGAEAAIVTGSYASARLAALAALAGGREVLIARGELVEFADGLRLEDAIRAAVVTARPVGAANKARSEDYASATGGQTAAWWHVQTVALARGTGDEIPLAELAVLARKHQVPLVDELDLGGFLDLEQHGLAAQPTAAASLKAGADLVLLAGDKLLGGPPAGILLGKRGLIDKIRRHSHFQDLAADRLRLTVLGATLRLYADTAAAERSIPLLALIGTSAENLKNRAERLAPQLCASGLVTAEARPGEASLTSAALPGSKLPTWQLAISPQRGTVVALAASLEAGPLPIRGRTEGERLILDLRTVFPHQDMQIADAFEALVAGPAAPSAPPPNAAADQPDPLPDPIT
ncbi:MAG: L-seryl-tRNA(Sec) selenium transferase [Pirellulaceae bacterium]|nr:L-seryl-tRNA(Sec) selenium transferase [Pirellulaceae bacterium]